MRRCGPSTRLPPLITGCATVAELVKLQKVIGCRGRITDATLNKDHANTDRGKIAGTDRTTNYDVAIAGAEIQTRHISSQFFAALRDKYPHDWQGVVKAITQDNPWRNCTLSGDPRKAYEPPNSGASGRQEVDATIADRTGYGLGYCGVSLNDGEWNRLPPDTIANGAEGTFKSVSNGYGTQGEVTHLLRGTAYRVRIPGPTNRA